MRWKIIFILVIMLCFTASCDYLERNKYDEIIKIAENLASDSANLIDMWIQSDASEINRIANEFSEMDSINQDEILEYLMTVHNENNLYIDVYMGFSNNTVIFASGFTPENLYESGWRPTERDWYQLALSDVSKAHITAPYIDTATNDLIITVCNAVEHNGEVVGVISADISMSNIQEMIMSLDLNETIYAMLLDSNGDILIHPGEFAPDNNEFNNLLNIQGGMYAPLLAQDNFSERTHRMVDHQGVRRFFTSSFVESNGWRLMLVYN